MTYFKYLKSLLRHKWFVFLECCKLGVPWLGVIHDWSKFRPSEFIPYARYFYGDYPEAPHIWRVLPGYSGPTTFSVENGFDVAWLHHQRRNKHHWQYWILIQDDDKDKTLAMPPKYCKEMLADWRGAGRAYGNPDTRSWYCEHYSKIQLNPRTREWIDSRLLSADKSE